MEVQKVAVSFKPYYKWNTFNTLIEAPNTKEVVDVLNLIINGIPSILFILLFGLSVVKVLNLIINGIPSILKHIKTFKS